MTELSFLTKIGYIEFYEPRTESKPSTEIKPFASSNSFPDCFDYLFRMIVDGLIFSVTEEVSLYVSIDRYTNIWLISSVKIIIRIIPTLCNVIAAIRFLFISPFHFNTTKYFTLYCLENKKTLWTIVKNYWFQFQK